MNEQNEIVIDGKKQQLPNSNAVLIMGIMSIVSICCGPMTILGIILGILSIVLGTKAIKEYGQDPDKYTTASMKNAKSGRVCGIVGVCLSFIWVIALFFVWIGMLTYSLLAI